MLRADSRVLKLLLNELDFVQDRIDKVGSITIEQKSWQESVDSWLALKDLLPVARSQRAVYSIFAKYPNAV